MATRAKLVRVLSGVAVLSGVWGGVLGGVGLGMVSVGVAAQPLTAGAAPVPATGNPSRDTMIKLTGRTITVSFEEARLEDVVKFLRDTSGAAIEVMWADDRNDVGLDKERQVTVKVENRTVLDVIERVLDQAAEPPQQNTWQMSRDGELQIGPKERLNKYRRVELYDIRDLILEVPNFRDSPRIDLQQALQAAQSGGGGGGQSPFTDTQGDEEDSEEAEQRRRERIDEVQRLIRDLVEPEQWIDNGGSGGSMSYYGNTLLVNAPDYMHRGINGYRWWPASGTSAGTVKGRRYVTLTPDAGVSTIDRIAVQPVTGTAGGQTGGGSGGAGSGGGGGGGR